MADGAFAESFGLYINWPLRLKKEIPFLRRILDKAHAYTVLDAGAGAGRHAVALALEGYAVSGFDLDQGLVDEARAHARETGQDVEFFTASFTDIPHRPPCGAILCIGNSLCMLPDQDAFKVSVASMASVLAPGGVLVAHVLNYRALRRHAKRFGPPRTLPDGRVVLKMFDLTPGALTVNIVILTPEKDRWKLHHTHQSLLDLDHAAFEQAFESAGLTLDQTFGSTDGSPFDPESSFDFFVTGVKPKE
jgi:glycine/sarcosine N-methyltransferase/sarcosine/dimethylglycine N-methyltransferase